MNVCKNCKHWDCNVEYRHRDNCNRCNILKTVVDIDLNQGSGWDSGGASVDEINTPFDFGCNKFEQMT